METSFQIVNGIVVRCRKTTTYRPQKATLFFYTQKKDIHSQMAYYGAKTALFALI